MDEDDLEVLWRDYMTRSKQVCRELFNSVHSLIIQHLSIYTNQMHSKYM
jgi:hypothetical protein